MHEKKHGVAFGMVIDLASIVILLILQVINAKIVLIKISDVSKTGKDYTEMKSSLESGKVKSTKSHAAKEIEAGSGYRFSKNEDVDETKSRAPDHCCFGKGEFGSKLNSSKHVPEYCSGMCDELDLPKNYDWTSKGYCITFKDTIEYCFKKYREYMRNMWLEKGQCFTRTRKYRHPIKIGLKDSFIKDDIWECQKLCQEYKRCGYFTYKNSTKECYMHKDSKRARGPDGDTRVAGHTSGPKHCEASRQTDYINSRQDDVKNYDANNYFKIIKGEKWYRSLPLR